MIKQRLREYLEAKHLSNREFERMCGLSNGLAARISPTTNPNTLRKIASSCDLNLDWLMTGEGDMYNDKHVENNTSMALHSARRKYEVPLIPVHAFAGNITESLEDAVFADECEKIVSPAPSAQWAMPVSGDSMEPQFADGSIVYLTRINDVIFIPWGNPMIIDTENGVYLKNLFPAADEDYIEARSNNPKYPPFLIPKSSIRGIYRVLNVSKFFTTM